MAAIAPHRTVHYVLRELPAAAAGYAGFGIFLLSIESNRLPAVQTVTARSDGPYSLLLDFSVLVVLAVVAFAFRNRLSSISMPSAVILAVGAAQSLSTFFAWNQLFVLEAFPLAEAFGRIKGIFVALLFFFWIREIYPRGPVSTATVYGLATIVLGLCSGFVAAMRAEAAVGVLAFLPFVSAICLCYFRRASRRAVSAEAFADPASIGSRSHGGAGSAESTQDDIPRAMGITIAIMVSLACYAHVFGYIHTEWVALQDAGDLSFTMQCGIATGSVLAGVFVIAFVRYAWSRFNLFLYLFALVPITILALWLTSFIHESSVFFYLVLLNFAQKSSFFVMLVMPFYIGPRRSLYWSWALVYFAFEFGKVLSSLSITYLSGDAYGMIATISIVVLFACCGLIVMLDVKNGSETGVADGAETTSGASTESALADASGAEGSEAQATQPGGKYRQACRDLADEYQLTEREYDVLLLIGRGRNAAFIAERLVVSPSTAKVYMRSIYAKMGIHSQQDIITLIEDRIEHNSEPASEGSS